MSRSLFCDTLAHMNVDGTQIAKEIFAELKAAVAKDDTQYSLCAITCAPNFETQKYLELKKRRAEAVGIVLKVVELPADATTKDVVQCVEQVSQTAQGIVVQLPLPEQIDREQVLRAVPTHQDPDGFSYGEKRDRMLPPVVGAIDEISKRCEVEWKNKRVVVLGQGRLVGLPAARYARKRGARVRVYEKHTLDPRSLKTADIIISGIGQPHYITADLVQSGVVVFDAGTSEDGGVLVGDVHPNVATVAAVYTPVPGGIGPITIALLLRNLYDLVRQ